MDIDPKLKCKSCGAPIVWAVSSKGRALPLDPEPSPKGNLSLDSGTPPKARVVQPHGLEGPLYTSHFATCPNAKKHRRKR
jgi:hypothetical protein